MGEERTNVIVPTGMETLDEILHGGIPRKHTVMVSGNSGTGKTILSLEWLFAGEREQDETGLYISLTEPVTDSTRNLRSLSFYDAEANVHFADLRTTMDLIEFDETSMAHKDVERLVEAIEQLVVDTGADRVVIDSVTAITYMLNDRNLIREFVFRLNTVLASHDVTTFLTSEVSGDNYSKYGVEEFVADGIIQLNYDCVNNNMKRTIQIVKMRGIEYETNSFHFTLDKRGAHIFYTPSNLDYGASNERVSIGVDGFDRMLNGGVFKGSTTLVSGATGVGKTLTCLHFAREGVQDGEEVLFISFEESDAHLIQTGNSLGWNLQQYVDEARLRFFCIESSSQYPEEYLESIVTAVRRNNTDRVVLDSLTAVQNAVPDEDFHTFVKKFVHAMKAAGVTTLMTSSHSSFRRTKQIVQRPVSTLVDNLLLLNYLETDGMMTHTVTALKARRSDHTRNLREYRINDDGLIVEEVMRSYNGLMTGSAEKNGETPEERIEQLFRDFLGDEGTEEFHAVEENGLSPGNVTSHIDWLRENGRLSTKDAEEFKSQAVAIITGDKPMDTDADPKKSLRTGILESLLGGR